jgi:hypothetical protein
VLEPFAKIDNDLAQRLDVFRQIVGDRSQPRFAFSLAR